MSNRNQQQIIAHISSSQQYIDTHGPHDNVPDGHAALRTAGAVAESATMEVPGGSSQALLDDQFHALNASRDSKLPAESLNQAFDSIQTTNVKGGHEMNTLNAAGQQVAAGKVISSRNNMEFRSQNEVSTQGALIGPGQQGVNVVATLGTYRPRELNDSSQFMQMNKGIPLKQHVNVMPSENNVMYSAQVS